MEEVTEVKPKCLCCGNDRFVNDHAGLVGRRWLVPDWAKIVICTRCGFIHFFKDPPPGEYAKGMDFASAVSGVRAVQDADLAAAAPDEATVCLGCGETIPRGETKCAICGWTYMEEERTEV